jgi:hypothetical protein
MSSVNEALESFEDNFADILSEMIGMSVEFITVDLDRISSRPFQNIVSLVSQSGYVLKA